MTKKKYHYRKSFHIYKHKKKNGENILVDRHQINSELK